jgi:hypothetical protein
MAPRAHQSVVGLVKNRSCKIDWNGVLKLVELYTVQGEEEEEGDCEAS